MSVIKKQFNYPGTDTPMSMYLFDADQKYHAADEQPSYQIFSRLGKVLQQQWHQHGVLHRTNGPAELFKDDAGEVITEHWIYRGTRINDLIDAGTVIIEDGKLPKDSIFTLEMMDLRPDEIS